MNISTILLIAALSGLLALIGLALWRGGSERRCAHCWQEFHGGYYEEQHTSERFCTLQCTVAAGAGMVRWIEEEQEHRSMLS